MSSSSPSCISRGAGGNPPHGRKCQEIFTGLNRSQWEKVYINFGEKG